MHYIEPEDHQMAAFLAEFPGDTSVVMLNLLRFREQAEYPPGEDEEPCTGFEAYIRYGGGVMPMIESAGGERVWQGRPAAMLIGPQDKHWNLAVLVRYPTAQAFVNMVSSPEYQEIARHRGAALVDSRLIALEEL